jgi:hypothetical protein
VINSDALLGDIRHYAEEYLREGYVESARDLAQTVLALDTVLSSGEAKLPAAWTDRR